MEIRTSLAIALSEKLGEMQKKKLPAKLSYAINRNTHALADIVDTFSQERQKLIGEYAEKNEDGSVKGDENNMIIWKDPEGFNEAIRAILEEKEDVKLHKVNADILDVLDDPRYDVLTPEDMEALSYMIEEG